MLKIRYNKLNGLLSGWTDIEAEFDSLVARKGEEVALLDVPKPDADDYEYFAYKDEVLIPSGKLPPSPPEPLVFTPLNPVQGVELRLDVVEKFLQKAYPEQ